MPRKKRSAGSGGEQEGQGSVGGEGESRPRPRVERVGDWEKRQGSSEGCPEFHWEKVDEYTDQGYTHVTYRTEYRGGELMRVVTHNRMTKQVVRVSNMFVPPEPVYFMQGGEG